jgi:hypothetical protein
VSPSDASSIDQAGRQWLLNVQPVVPFTLNAEWNVISRILLPVVSQKDIFPGAGSQSGLSDIVQSVFFSPKAPTAGGWIWSAGPVLLLPTGTNDLLSAKKWGLGPTAVLLKQDHGWTYGALTNHIWSVAGDSARSDISTTFVQPFLSYTTPTAWTYAVNTESTYDWKSKQWSVPLNLFVSKVTKIDTQLISVGGGVRYWADGPTGPTAARTAGACGSSPRCCSRSELTATPWRPANPLSQTRASTCCATMR